MDHEGRCPTRGKNPVYLVQSNDHPNHRILMPDLSPQNGWRTPDTRGVRHAVTNAIRSIIHLYYWEWLNAFRLHSLERRQKRYCNLKVETTLWTRPRPRQKICHQGKVLLRARTTQLRGKRLKQSSGTKFTHRMVSLSYSGSALFHSISGGFEK